MHPNPAGIVTATTCLLTWVLVLSLTPQQSVLYWLMKPIQTIFLLQSMAAIGHFPSVFSNLVEVNSGLVDNVS